MVSRESKNLIMSASQLAGLKPPISDDLWTFFTYENPIYWCLVNYLNSYDRLKLAMSSVLIQKFMFSVGALPIDDDPVLNCRAFIEFLPGPRQCRSLLIHFKIEELVLPALYRLAVSTFPKMLKVSTLTRLDLTLDGVCEFLITQNSNLKQLIIRHTSQNVNPGDRGLLASCRGVTSLQIHQGVIDREIALRIGMLHLTELHLIGVRISVVDVRFVVRELSRCYHLHTLIWKYYGTNFVTNIDSFFAEEILTHCKHAFRNLRVLELTTFKFLNYLRLLALPELRWLTLNLAIGVRQDSVNQLCLYLRKVQLSTSPPNICIRVYKVHREEYSELGFATRRSFWLDAGIAISNALPDVDFAITF